MSFQAEEFANAVKFLTDNEEFLCETVRNFVRILGKCSGELASSLNSLRIHTVNQRIDTVKRFQAAGFTREQAMDMAESISNGMRDSIRSVKS